MLFCAVLCEVTFGDALPDEGLKDRMVVVHQ